MEEDICGIYMCIGREISPPTHYNQIIKLKFLIQRGGALQPNPLL